MSDDGSDGTARPVQPAALDRICKRLHHAAEAPWLHREVARRMSERLGLIRVQPAMVIDWWSFNGASGALLRQAYPRARVQRVEDDVARLQGSHGAPAPWWSPRSWRAAGHGAVAAHDVAAGGAGLVWANMMLHLVADPQATLRRWQQALAIDGFVMFSTLGPGSLAGLRDFYVQQDWPAPHAAFVDMHDLGDMLVRAGFADPVMDQETLTLTWPDADALLAELRSLGGNADPQRFAGLRTPRWRRRLLAGLHALQDAQGRLRLDFELVYGHAFKAAPKQRPPAQTSVALDDMRALLRASRDAPGPRQRLR